MNLAMGAGYRTGKMVCHIFFRDHDIVKKFDIVFIFQQSVLGKGHCQVRSKEN